MAATGSRRNRELAFGRAFRVFAALLMLAACGDENKGEASMLFKKDTRVIAGKTELNEQGISLELQPPLEVHNTVQYVALAIAGASQWRSGSEPGTLVSPDGRTYRISVDLESASSQRFELRSPSFGKDLMFSHLRAGAAAGDSDLPKGQRFVRLWLKSSPAIVADEVRWSDITNK